MTESFETEEILDETAMADSHKGRNQIKSSVKKIMKANDGKVPSFSVVEVPAEKIKKLRAGDAAKKLIIPAIVGAGIVATILGKKNADKMPSSVTGRLNAARKFIGEKGSAARSAVVVKTPHGVKDVAHKAVDVANGVPGDVKKVTAAGAAATAVAANVATAFAGKYFMVKFNLKDAKGHNEIIVRGDDKAEISAAVKKVIDSVKD